MILEVEVTPLTVVVKVLPEAEVVRELMKLTTFEAIPFTIDVKLLVVVDTVLVLMIDDVADTPLVELVSVLPEEERVLDEITDEVAVTPLIVVVKVLPDKD